MTSSRLLFTASWRTAIDPNRYALIGISRSSPRGRSGYRCYRPLVPGGWFRDPMDEATWVDRYETEVLSRLDPKVVLHDLTIMAAGRPAVLLCWEPAPAPPADAWCHRGLVSKWLQEHLGLDVPELGYEHLGCGCRHPKLPAVLQRV